MTYHRQSLLNRSRMRAPSTDPRRLERLVSIATLVSTSILGVGTIALALVGLNMTREFNAWQRSVASQQDQSQQLRSASLDNQSLRDRCIRVADLYAEMAMGRNEADATDILRRVADFEPNCRSVGIDVTQLSALAVVERPDRYDARIAARAALITSSRNGGSARDGRSADPSPGTQGIATEPSTFNSLPEVNWRPQRIDVARALLSAPGDDTKLFSFNVGTAF